MARRRIGPDEPVYLIGGRRFVRRETDVVIARKGKWLLVNVADWGAHGWISTQLYLDDPDAPKRMWQIGVKDGVAARNVSVRLLEQYHPGMLDWVIKRVGMIV
jgi:hypothetical protein